MDELVLQTDRIDLRRIGLDDVDLHDQFLNSQGAMERLGGPRTRDQLAEKHAKSRASFAAHGFGFMFGWERATGELICHCGMKLVDDPNAVNQGDHEIGWLVREDRWREGFAEEAMKAIVNWAFDGFGVPHVVALTSEANVASWKLMEKLGMSRAPELDFTDPSFPAEDSPTIQYRLTRDERVA